MKSRAQLIAEAERLASSLFAERVGRNDVRGVLDLLVHAPGEWDERREKCGELLRLLPESWVRGTKWPILKDHVRPLLGGRSEDEVRFLLGWAARILYVRGKAEHHGRRDP
jgi:hypothetical protein